MSTAPKRLFFAATHYVQPVTLSSGREVMREELIGLEVSDESGPVYKAASAAFDSRGASKLAWGFVPGKWSELYQNRALRDVLNELPEVSARKTMAQIREDLIVLTAGQQTALYYSGPDYVGEMMSKILRSGEDRMLPPNIKAPVNVLWHVQNLSATANESFSLSGSNHKSADPEVVGHAVQAILAERDQQRRAAPLNATEPAESQQPVRLAVARFG